MPDTPPTPQQVVAIAGGTRNIGLSVARTVLDHGGQVAICGRRGDGVDSALEALAGGDRVSASTVDVSDPADVNRWAADLQRNHPPLTGFVFAAVQRVHERIEDFGPDLWRQAIETSLSGAFYCTRALLPGLAQEEGGSVIFIGGRSAHAGAPNRSSVVASKAGLVGLARGLSLELADRRVRVNVVVPGRIKTERGEWTSDGNPDLIAEHYANGTQPDEAPLGPGYPEDIADVVEYLLSNRSRYITGQTLHVNGGTHF